MDIKSKFEITFSLSVDDLRYLRHLIDRDLGEYPEKEPVGPDGIDRARLSQKIQLLGYMSRAANLGDELEAHKQSDNADTSGPVPQTGLDRG